jgi:hypothetical protein
MENHDGRAAAVKLALKWGGSLWMALALQARAEQPVKLPFDFVGRVTLGITPVFGLTDKASGSSGWKKIGESFDGYTLKSYDAEAELLTFSQGTTEVKLRLKDAHIESASISKPNKPKRLADRVDQALTDQLKGWVLPGAAHLKFNQQLEDRAVELKIGEETSIDFGSNGVLKILTRVDKEANFIYEIALHPTDEKGPSDSRVFRAAVVQRAGAFTLIQKDVFSFSFSADGEARPPVTPRQGGR